MNHVTKMGKDNCPACDYFIDHSTPLQGSAIPVPGDLAVCLKCGSFLHYEDDMKLGVLPKVIFDSLDEKLKFKLNQVKNYIIHEKIKQN